MLPEARVSTYHRTNQFHQLRPGPQRIDCVDRRKPSRKQVLSKTRHTIRLPKKPDSERHYTLLFHSMTNTRQDHSKYASAHHNMSIRR
ncbi:glycoside hydrolase family 76 protein [Moniliophthora roreri]|nr:glycoside hydrolase family 76 protein [Moniliophthora roreri]